MDTGQQGSWLVSTQHVWTSVTVVPVPLSDLLFFFLFFFFFLGQIASVPECLAQV